jgi:hypothetical protein
MYQPEHGPWYEIKEKPGRIKVGLVGTCSIGKTSIINYFEAKYANETWPQVVVVPEAATLFFGNPKTTGELIALNRERDYGEPSVDMLYWHPHHDLSRTYWRTQWHLMHYANYLYEERRRMYGFTNPSFLCDRIGPICAPVYTLAGGDPEHSQIMVDEGVAYAYWPTYTHICLLDPNGVPYIQNEVRDETQEERLRIHEVYLEFFDRYKIPFKLISGTLEERIVQVESLLIPE